MSQLAKSKPRLGRGLSSLISVSDLPVDVQIPPAPPNTPAAESSPTATVAAGPPAGSIEIPLDQISFNPHQPRKSMNETALAELAASMKTNGVIQAVVVKRTAEGYQLIAGERRVRAAKIAGLAGIPAIVREADGFTQAQLALVENIQREDLNPLDRAEAYQALIQQLGLTQQELAGRLGEERGSVSNFLRILELCDYAQIQVSLGRLSLGHAKLLLNVADRVEQERIAKLVVLQSLSVRNLERLVARATGASLASKPGGTTSPHMADLEKNISRQLGMRTQVKASKQKKGRGRLVIHYNNLDQFDELLGRLGVKTE